MNYYYNSDIAIGTNTSFEHFIGDSNSAQSLIANPTQCLFIKGATATLTVKLQAAAPPTPKNQQVVIDPNDWMDIGTYTADTYTTFPSLNGLWVRFQVINSGSGPAPITISLES